MKNMLLFVALCAPVWVRGQTVDGINLAEKKEIEYVQLLGIDMGIFKKKLTVIVDYGQKIKAFDTDTRVQDEKGEPIIFNSMVDALNHFNGQGWEFVTAYAISNPGTNGSTYHYLMRRKG
jgi:hypothetical protein